VQTTSYLYTHYQLACVARLVSKLLHKCDANLHFEKEAVSHAQLSQNIHEKEDKMEFNAKVPHADGTAQL